MELLLLEREKRSKVGEEKLGERAQVGRIMAKTLFHKLNQYFYASFHADHSRLIESQQCSEANCYVDLKLLQLLNKLNQHFYASFHADHSKLIECPQYPEAN